MSSHPPHLGLLYDPGWSLWLLRDIGVKWQHDLSFIYHHLNSFARSFRGGETQPHTFRTHGQTKTFKKLTKKTYQKNLPKKLTKTRKFFESFGLAATRLLTEWVRRIQLRKNSTTMQDSDNDDHTRILTPSFKPSNQTPSMNQTVGTCAEDLDSHPKETPPRQLPWTWLRRNHVFRCSTCWISRQNHGLIIQWLHPTVPLLA